MFHLSELQNAAVLEAQGALDDAAVASEEK
jgi:hypothetical protein